MIPIKTYKNYWLSIQTRLPDIKHILFVYHEEDLALKIRDIPAQELILVAVVPSSDGIEFDKDNLRDATALLIYVIEKLDRKDITPEFELNVMEVTQNMTKAIKKLVYEDATTCGNYCHEFLNGIDFNKMHIDPEDNYLGCNGWSISFFTTDPYWTYEDDEFQEEYGLPPVTITDGETEVEKLYGESYTCKYGSTPAVVKNSDDTYEDSVIAPGPLVLPDITFKDSDGSESQVPACKDIVATPQAPIPEAEVENSDQSYQDTFTPPGPHVLPDITFKDSDGSESQVPACKDIEASPIPDAQVENSDQSYQDTFAPPGPLVLPDINFTDSDGSVSQVPACKDIVATPIPDERIMDFGFPATYEDEILITVGDNQASTWISESLTNVVAATYEKNGAPASLPITLSNGDTLKVSITRTDPALDSRVILENS